MGPATFFFNIYFFDKQPFKRGRCCCFCVITYSIGTILLTVVGCFGSGKWRHSAGWVVMTAVGRKKKSILKVDQVWAGRCFSFAMLLRANVFYCLCHGVSIKKYVKSLFLLFCCSSLRWNKRQLSRNGLSGCGVVFTGSKYFFSSSFRFFLSQKRLAFSGTMRGVYKISH